MLVLLKLEILFLALREGLQVSGMILFKKKEFKRFKNKLFYKIFALIGGNRTRD